MAGEVPYNAVTSSKMSCAHLGDHHEIVPDALIAGMQALLTRAQSECAADQQEFSQLNAYLGILRQVRAHLDVLRPVLAAGGGTVPALQLYCLLCKSPFCGCRTSQFTEWLLGSERDGIPCPVDERGHTPGWRPAKASGPDSQPEPGAPEDASSMSNSNWLDDILALARQ